MPSFSFIIGGNRGIGLALVKELVGSPQNHIAKSVSTD